EWEKYACWYAAELLASLAKEVTPPAQRPRFIDAAIAMIDKTIEVFSKDDIEYFLARSKIKEKREFCVGMNVVDKLGIDNLILLLTEIMLAHSEEKWSCEAEIERLNKLKNAEVSPLPNESTPRLAGNPQLLWEKTVKDERGHLPSP